MAILIQARWILLAGALLCSVLFGLALFVPPLLQALPGDPMLIAIIILQPLGVFAMSRHLRAQGSRGGWATIVGYVASFLWLMVFVSGRMAVEAGPGGLVYGILLTLPGIALGLLTQIAAVFGFLAKAKAR